MGAATSPLEAVARAAAARRRADVHLLIGALVVTGLSATLTPGDSALTLLGWELPPLCLSRILLDRECLGCGMTRSFTYMGHLDPAGAWRLHKLGPLLYALVAAQIPYRAWRLLRPAGGPVRGPAPPLDPS